MVKSIFSPWVIIGGVVLALILTGIAALLLFGFRPEAVESPPATAFVLVIRAPTATPVPPTPTPTIPASPTSALPPPPPEGVIASGAYVQISGTGGDGLRLRDDAGLQSAVRVIGGEAEVFQVTDGPRDVDGYTWWYLVGPFDESRQGWAVSNYLAVVQNP